MRELLVPTLSLYEVFKRILQQRDEGQTLQAVALMQQARVVELAAPLALAAARVSLEQRLPMADSIMVPGLTPAFATVHAETRSGRVVALRVVRTPARLQGIGVEVHP